MRLMSFDKHGELLTTSFFGGDIPPYAILSHTWGPDQDEVTLADLQNNTAKSKRGYRKIDFCREQAAQHGLQYFWIDTCCIDKSSSAELSTAINSMYRWYQQAKRCYVFLADVTKAEDQSWESMFCRSRWFTRGWTLQELIAPSSVDFFSCEGEHLGNKLTLESMVCAVTGIPSMVIRSAFPNLCSIEDRLGWIKGRTTKLEEDMVYCMLGILDVSLPFVYGEGARNTFMRLHETLNRKKAFDSIAKTDTNVPSSLFQLLIDLKPAEQARSPDREHQGDCMKEREISCLKTLWFPGITTKVTQVERPAANTCQWIFDHPIYKCWSSGQRKELYRGLMWLKGNPGVGKSTIMKEMQRRFIHESVEDRSSVAAFFFDAKGEQLAWTNLGQFRSLLYQLLPKSPIFLQKFCNTVAEQSSSNSKSEHISVDWQVNTLRDLLSDLLQSGELGKTIIFIDALDECFSEDIRKEAQFWREVTMSAAEAGIDLFVCISSRHFPQITLSDCPIIVVEDCNGNDIASYVELKLASGMPGAASDGTRNIIKSRILAKAAGIFLWATLVVNDLLEKWNEGMNERYLLQRLEIIPQDLTLLYRHMLMDLSPEDKAVATRLFHWVSLAAKPLRIHEWHHIMAFIRETKPDSLQEWRSSDFFTENQDQLEKQIRTISKGLVEFKTFADELIDDFLDYASVKAGAGSLNLETGDTRYVQAIHDTVRLFHLYNGFGMPNSNAEIELAIGEGHVSILNTCLDYIEIKELDALIDASLDAMEPPLPGDALLKYSGTTTKNSPPCLDTNENHMFTKRKLKTPEDEEGVEDGKPTQDNEVSSTVADTWDGRLREDIKMWLCDLPSSLNDPATVSSPAISDLERRTFEEPESLDGKQRILEDFPALLSYITTYFMQHLRLAQLNNASTDRIIQRLTDTSIWRRWQVIGEDVPLSREASLKRTYLASEGVDIPPSIFEGQSLFIPITTQKYPSDTQPSHAAQTRALIPVRSPVRRRGSVASFSSAGSHNSWSYV